MSRARAGFTLLELLVALVITGVIALSAYGALDAGLTTRARIDGPLHERESALLARTLLEDALRHRVERGAESAPLVQDGGAAGDILSFDTRGVGAPFGGSGLWHVEVRGGTITLTSAEQQRAGLRTSLGARAIVVSARGAEGWTRATAADQTARAIRVDFVPRAGEEALAPLVVFVQGAVLR